jgi:hypothetical protein
MPKKIDDENYQILLDGFREAGEYYFANAKTKEQKAALVNLLTESLRGFTIDAQKYSIKGCKAGKVRCRDGSCMPKGMCKPLLKNDRRLARRD